MPRVRNDKCIQTCRRRQGRAVHVAVAANKPISLCKQDKCLHQPSGCSTLITDAQNSVTQQKPAVGMTSWLVTGGCSLSEGPVRRLQGAGQEREQEQEQEQAARAKADRLRDLYLSYLTRDVCIPPICDKQEGCRLLAKHSAQPDSCVIHTSLISP